MQQRKNKFLTVVFSMMFGAGQMYMGFMKQGLSIMGCTLGVIALGSLTGLNIIYLALPLFWFYSFFDTMNKRGMSEVDFKKLKDSSIIPTEINIQRIQEIGKRFQMYIGGGFIFIGICILNSNMLSYIFSSSSFLVQVTAPEFLISVLMIVVGAHLIFSRKQEQPNSWKNQKILEEESFKAEVKEDNKIIDAPANIETAK